MKGSLFVVACLQVTAAVASCLPVDFEVPQISIQDEDVNVEVTGITFDKSCDAKKIAVINKELSYAKGMANIAAANIRGQNDLYYASFFSAALRATPNFERDMKDIFKRASELMTQKVNAYPMTFACNNGESLCKKNQYAAFVRDRSKLINFCDVFFDPKKSSVADPSLPAADRLKECKTMTIRQAHRSLAAVIVHELMHTSYASGSSDV